MVVDHIHEKNLKGIKYHANILLDRYNKRIKLFNYSGDIYEMVEHFKNISSKENMSKIIYYGKNEDKLIFQQNGFIEEGKINGYFKGETAYCLAYFDDPSRQYSDKTKEEDDILKKALEVKGKSSLSQLDKYKIRNADQTDAQEIAKLFQSVFVTYPTPMNDDNYIKTVMKDKVLFKVAEYKGEIVSVSSAEMNKDLMNAEITDCATKHEHRGKGLVNRLIVHLERQLFEEGFRTLYSLARAISHGINIVLSRNGYMYSGRMINNCNIMGKMEDMNIWVKEINK